MTQLNILVLDDEKRIREELNYFLRNNDYKVYEASTPSEAMKIIKQNQIEIAIVDINLPEKDGLEVLKEIKNYDEDIEVLLITGQGDMNTAIQAMRWGAADFFNKPIRLNEVLHAIQRTTRYINLSKRYQQIRHSYDRLSAEVIGNPEAKLLGQSSAMNKVRRDIALAAEHPDTPVMITGESGTGKELAARNIHFLSNRKNHHFHAVNCAAIPESLFESEFFGYLRGAFTNAINGKPGWFELSDKGSLFLDEIGEMYPMMQAKLLRIVEDGKVRRLGANSDQSVNVRIITATNRDIGTLVKSGVFRQDLFHRLNTLQLKLPPLRERKEDIPILVDYYIQMFARKTGKTIHGIESSLLEKLSHYHYPGNIRELKNMLERAIILCDNSRLSIKHFTSDTFCPRDKGSISKTNNSTDETYDLEILEKATVQKALDKTGWNKQQAARLLNISWQALERRIEKYQLQ